MRTAKRYGSFILLGDGNISVRVWWEFWGAFCYAVHIPVMYIENEHFLKCLCDDAKQLSATHSLAVEDAIAPFC